MMKTLFVNDDDLIREIFNFLSPKCQSQTSQLKGRHWKMTFFKLFWFMSLQQVRPRHLMDSTLIMKQAMVKKTMVCIIVLCFFVLGHPLIAWFYISEISEFWFRWFLDYGNSMTRYGMMNILCHAECNVWYNAWPVH